MPVIPVSGRCNINKAGQSMCYNTMSTVSIVLTRKTGQVERLQTNGCPASSSISNLGPDYVVHVICA